MKNIFIIAALLFLALYGYKNFQAKETATDDFDIPPTYNTAYETVDELGVSASSLNNQSYNCDGRMHCSQMTSCEEATYFINHCPNTKMDGNNDGIPCESQFCY